MVQKTQKIIELWAKISNPSSWRYARRIWKDEITPFKPRYPQPGYIGTRYRKRKIVVLGTNPGHGKRSEFHESDRKLFTLTRTLAKEPTLRNYRRLMNYQAEIMPRWDIFSAIDFPNCFGLELRDLAYFNILHVNTNIGPYDVSDDLYEYVIKKFTSRQLNLLNPKAIIVIGIHAHEMLCRYWDEMPANIPIQPIIHPTGRYGKQHPERLRQEIEVVKNLVSTMKSAYRKG